MNFSLLSSIDSSKCDKQKLANGDDKPAICKIYIRHSTLIEQPRVR